MTAVVLITSASVGLLLIGLMFAFRKHKNRKGKRIPGPHGLPLVGYAFSLRQGRVHEQFSQMAEKYGDIFRIKMFGKSFIVLNTVETIKKAFNNDPYKKYMNDRVPTFFGDWVFFDSQGINFMPKAFGSEHGYLRKAFARGMPTYGEGRKEFEENVNEELDKLCKRIEKYQREEFDMIEFLKRSLTNSVSILLGGHELEDDDEDLNMFWDFDTSMAFLLKQHTDSLLRKYPWMRLFGFYKRPLALIQHSKEQILKRYFDDMKATYKAGEVRGFVDFMLNEQDEAENEGDFVLFTDERIKAMILETINSGILTSLATLSSFFLCMLNYPEYQTKIQEEIDRVIGKDEWPKILDRQLCPVTEAVCMEVQRYISVANISATHYCEPNIAFEGFDIPEKSTIIPNIWHVHHDPKVWVDPWNFRPERWLDEFGELLPAEDYLRKNFIPFGTGKRACVGESLARGRMFLFVASLLQKFTFEFLPGQSVPCDPRAGHYHIDLTIRPKSFKCRAVPRE